MSEVLIPIKDITYLDKNKEIDVYNTEKHFGYKDTRSDYQITKQLLETKRPSIGEIELTLFENCPINCDFCYHDKNSKIGMTKEEIFSKLDIIEPFLRDREGTVDLMQFNIVGGELFQERFLNEYIPIYIELGNKLKDLCNKYNYNCNIVWVSNFLFSSSNLILDLVEQLQSDGVNNSLICSYDFSGRPTNNAYYRNIKALEEHISSINIVGTTETIDDLMRGDDKFFNDYLYKTFPIYLDDFIPDEGTDELIPTDREFYELYVFIADNYPDINPIKELITGENKSMSCLSLNKLTIFPDNSTSNCKWHRYKPRHFNTYKNKDRVNYEDNAPQMQRHLDVYGCLSCEYFQKCPLRCFTQWDFISDGKRNFPGCWIKGFFKTLDGNPPKLDS